MWFPTGCCPNAEDYKERLTGFVFGHICGRKGTLIKNALAVSSEYVIDLHHVPAGCKLFTPTLCVTQVGNKMKIAHLQESLDFHYLIAYTTSSIVSSAFFEVSGSKNSSLPDMSRVGIASLDVVP